MDRFGNPSYAGSYRMAYLQDGTRFLEVRRAGGWHRIDIAIPRHIRGCYAAASYLGV